MSIFSRKKAEDVVENTRDQSPDTIPPVRTTSDRTVQVGDALTLTSVYRSIQIISTAVRQMSIAAYRANEEVRSPLFIQQPDPDISRSAFLEEVTVSLAATGNAYLQVIRDNKDNIVLLKTLNPLGCFPNVDVEGNVINYTYNGKEYSKNSIRHLKLMRLPGLTTGKGPIQACQLMLRGSIDLRDYASNLFDSGGIPNGLLSTDQELTQDQAETAKGIWNAAQSLSEGVAVLGNGLDYKPLLLSPKDAQFLESQNFSTAEIARLFGVPAHLINAEAAGSSMTYSNVESANIEFLRFTLSAYTREIEEALSSLLPRGQEVRFNYDSLLRTDSLTRYQAHAIALTNGFLTKDEVRELENRSPLTADQMTQDTKTTDGNTPPEVDVSNA